MSCDDSGSGFRERRPGRSFDEADRDGDRGPVRYFDRSAQPKTMNPHIVPPSQHTLFMRGFNPNTEMHKIRDFFTKEGGKCSFDFFKVSQDGTRLFVALRFESKDVARDVLNRYDNTSVLGSKITITWFKDLRRARLKAMQHGQRWSNFYGNMKNGYNRGYPHKFGGGKLKSAIWRQPGKGDHYQYMHDRRNKKDRKHGDHRSSSSSRSRSYSHSRSRSHSRTKSRSRSRSHSHSRSRSWTHSRSRERSGSPVHRYRTPSSSSSRGSSRTKRRAWKSDSVPFAKSDAFPNPPPDGGGAAPDAPKPELPPDAEPNADVSAKTDDGTLPWDPSTSMEPDDTIKSAEVDELLELAQLQCASPSNEKAGNESEPSRSRSSSTSEHSHNKDRKKKKKKHHRSKHRRHRHHRRHHHHPSSDEEGQVIAAQDRSNRELVHSMEHGGAFAYAAQGGDADGKGEGGPGSGPNAGFGSLNEFDLDDIAGINPAAPTNNSLAPPDPAKLALRAKISVATKTLLEKYKSSIKSAQAKDGQMPSKRTSPPKGGLVEDIFAIGGTQKLDLPAPNIRCFSPDFDVADKDGGHSSNMPMTTSQAASGELRNHLVDESTAVTNHTPSPIRSKFHIDLSALQTDSMMEAESSEPSKKKGRMDSASSMSKDKVMLIRRKRAEIEKAYRRDSETFSSVVKMLVRKDPSLEEKIQDSFRENLFDIGQHCIRDLQEFIETLATADDTE